MSSNTSSDVSGDAFGASQPIQAQKDAAADARRRAARRKAILTGPVAAYSLSVLMILAFVGAWQAASDTGLVNPFFVSSPTRVGDRLAEMLTSSQTWNDTWVTMQEALWGFVIGCSVGILIGFILGQSKLLARACLPILNLVNTLPRVALAPLFILWFGIDQTSKIMLV